MKPRDFFRKKVYKSDLTTGDVARLFKVTQQTIIRDCKRGDLKFHLVLNSKHRRITPKDLLTYMGERGLPVDIWEDIFNPRILLVSANSELEANIRQLLADRVCRIESTDNVFDAGIKIGMNFPACVILDLRMGRKVATDIALRIRNIEPCKEVVLIGLTHTKRSSLIGFDQTFNLKTGQNELADFILEEPFHA